MSESPVEIILLQMSPESPSLGDQGLGGSRIADSRWQRDWAWRLRDQELRRRAGLAASTPLRFAKTEHGKPYWPQRPEVHFNLSHCARMVAVAIADQPLGLDVECLPRAANWASLAPRYFQAREWRQIQGRPPAEQSRLATALWSAKEALVKRSGLGIAGMAALPALQWENERWWAPEQELWQLCEQDYCVSLAARGESLPPAISLREPESVQATSTATITNE